VTLATTVLVANCNV